MDLSNNKKFIWGLSYDLYRFAGLQVLFQSLCSGSTLVIPKNISDMIEMNKKIFRKQKINSLSATATYWRKFLMQKHSGDINFKTITLGGEIADNQILNALKKKYPDAKISHIYASTEAGVGFAVRDGMAGFPKSYLTDGFDNKKFKVDKNNQLMILDKNQVQNYVSSNDCLYDSDGFIPTGDIIEILGDRVFFKGRESGSINVGGNKVIPEEVERALMASDLVSQAFVYGKKIP